MSKSLTRPPASGPVEVNAARASFKSSKQSSTRLSLSIGLITELLDRCGAGISLLVMVPLEK